MNDDFFEKYNTYRPQPQDHEVPDARQQYASEEPLTQLYGNRAAAQPTSVQQTPDQQPASSYTNPYADLYTPKAEKISASPTTYQPVDAAAPRYASDESSDGYYHRSFTRHEEPAHRSEKHADRKEKKSGVGKGAIAALLIICILLSGVAGFGGSILASKLNLTGNKSDDDALVVRKVEAVETSAGMTSVDKSTSEITGEVADSVVEITTEVVQTSNFYGQYIQQGAGSGVIIDDKGIIITNNHVIDGAKTITVTLRSGESYDAELIGADEELDIALIKIDPEDKELTTAVIGNSAELNVGDKAVIIGNPLGTLGGSVTEGIISALDRSIVVDGKTMTLMQTDAAINAGNSGGGMFNGQGELVGIVVAKNYSGEVDNIGFVIPIDNAMNILGDLKQYGYVRGKADTGMTFIDLSNQLYAWYYYGTSEPGCYISSVDSGSNAERAGFREGDRVISIDDEEVSDSASVKNIISGKSVGDEVTFKVERGGRTGTLTLKLEEKIPDSARSDY